MGFVDSRAFKIILWLFGIFIFYHSWIINHDKDFDIFIEASKMMFRGESPYELWLGKAGLKYYYSPFWAMILYPLKETPQLFYAFVWTALNFYFLFRILQLLMFFFRDAEMQSNKRRLFILFCFLCSIRFVLDNLGLGQMTIFLLWASLETARLEHQGKWLAAGTLLAFVINVKLLPVALLCYFFYTGSWKTSLSTLGMSVLFIIAPALVWGFELNNHLHAEWLRSLTGTSVNSIVEDDNRPGLSSLVPSLIMETPLKFGLSRNFVSLGPAAVQLVTNVARLVFVVIGLLLISRPFTRPAGKVSLFYDVAVICLLTPLVYPHQGKYALLYTLPAYAMAIFVLLSRNRPWDAGPMRPVFFLLLLSFLLVTLTTDGLITRAGSDFAEYFHLLTYGTFALLAVMVLIKKEIPGPDLQT